MSKLEFQLYDYRETHQTFEDEDSENNNLGEYIIQIFGRTMDGKSVYAKLRNFQPRFYIKVPDNWNKSECQRLTKWLTSKDNRKIYYHYKKGLVKTMILKRKKAYGFSNNKEFKFICLLFSNSFAMRKFADFFELNPIRIPGLINRSKTFKVYESNLLSMLRCFHIQDIPGCGWVETSDYTIIDKDEQDSTCDLEIILNYKDIKPIKKEVNAPLRILSFDIECDSCDGQFPQANRMKDNIIQIGSAYTLLGKSEPYRQHMVTLGSCDKIEGAFVESFEDEKDMILAWIDEVKNYDADIITGYNIFYFDEKYIHDRAKMLGIEVDCAYMSKLKNHKCYFKEMKLASSALGENLLRYYDTPGLVHIDLMKDVQKTYKLDSYKLDRVASNFINGDIKEIVKLKNNRYKLFCNQINDLYLEDYIHIELKESFVSEDIGEKFKVNKLNHDDKTIVIKSDIDLIKECNFSRGKIIWSQAKDDVSPKEIFRLQHTTSAGRCKVAKYCLKDCRLVNLLINKLEVVTKNIEMANVCYVPFQYLFTRGQGIKLFSLCMKEYRKHKFLFPKMKALTDEEKEALGKYEGAIVFDPIPNVSYQAYAVKDYASLYPSSIIHKNMSHETKVDDDDYDNLPGIEYFNARFRNGEGKWEYRRFAKLKNEFGVVPTILQTLLGERKSVKKQMKQTKDPFKYSILDAKQSALKVTANSLYGQLGASTSPIRERDIAACTTSTGRELLILAKKYDEEVLPYIMNGMKTAFKNDDEETINQIRINYFSDPNDDKLFLEIKEYLENTESYLCNPIIRYGDTDSIFTNYNFTENFTKVSKSTSVTLFKKIIKFGLKLIILFIPIVLREEFEELYNQYYINIKTLQFPTDLKWIPEPEHWKTVYDNTTLLKQFLKEYVEESYLPWLWTLQDIFTQDLTYLSESDYNDILNIKIFNEGRHHIDKIGLDRIGMVDKSREPIKHTEIHEDNKKRLVNAIKIFMKDTLKDYRIYPYFEYSAKKKILLRKINFYQGGNYLIDKRSLKHSIKLGVLSGALVKQRLPFPHDLEYEKTFYPFLILTKKRYVGHKYEFDENNYKFDYNGIVLKRRDNAPIVKEVCSGIIKKLIIERSPQEALDFAIDTINKMFQGEYNIKYFLTSKTLKMKESYVNWTRMGHVVLSERIGLRDPGNKPQAGDRITYAAIEVKNPKGKLQGELIETPEFIKEKKLKVDYLFYLTNQIEKPALQFLALVNPEAVNILKKIKIRENQKRLGIVDINNFLNEAKSLYDF